MLTHPNASRRSTSSITPYRVGAAILCCAAVAGLFLQCDAEKPSAEDLPFNLHPIADGIAYRSAQPTDTSLTTAIEHLGLKTVVNLRGENAGDAWYDEERAACEAAGVTLVDIRMSAHSLPTRESLLALYDTFTNAAYPMLIHCQGGADRSGAAAAIWRMVVQQHPREQAAAELSTDYYHFRWYAPEMDQLVELFEPDREWILNTYDPATAPPSKTPPGDADEQDD